VAESLSSGLITFWALFCLYLFDFMYFPSFGDKWTVLNKSGNAQALQLGCYEFTASTVVNTNDNFIELKTWFN